MALAARTHPLNSPPPPNAHVQGVQRSDLVDQFGRDRPLPRDHVGMIEWRNDRGAALRREPRGYRLTILAIAIVNHHLSPITAGRLHLGLRRVAGHDDRCRRPVQPRRQRDCLRMIARGEGDDATRARLRSHRGQRVERAAKLERARPLEIFALEEHRGTRGLVDGA
jgi:hypothetical protein